MATTCNSRRRSLCPQALAPSELVGPGVQALAGGVRDEHLIGLGGLPDPGGDVDVDAEEVTAEPARPTQ